ncbi:uncharacterized protein APUU_30816A [Aspergillus puulaauensis]|uniref:Uncharacterized protein n=1 Tax=Aspergillus puulaauensis TaxID=1220207 RepID=A0A7R7XJD5_9EURO|nr:uncharacterized protein APUU_30816A [Aspergillus puulaauensis]BCS22591.1 hypothetical protein APUU_30816A [Aspergillus puulaauensis]
MSPDCWSESERCHAILRTCRVPYIEIVPNTHSSAPRPPRSLLLYHVAKGHTLAKFVPVVVEQEQEDMVRNTPLRPAMNVETTSQLGLWWWDTSMPFDRSGLTTMENPSVMVVRPNGGTPGAATALEEYETRYFGRPIGHSLFLILEDNPGIIGVSI